MTTSSLSRQYGLYRTTEMIEGAADSALYYALNTRSGQVVMLRVLSVRRPMEGRTLAQTLDRIAEEIAVLQQLAHSHLLPIVDHGTAGAHVYLAYPSSGLSLARALYGEDSLDFDSSQPLLHLPSLDETSGLLQQVGAALQAVHDSGQVHGQIEPRAIYLQDGQGYLFETGMPRLHKIIFRMDATSSLSPTRYSAPEVWQAERIVPASDQYALACVAYELVTGRAPFESLSILDLMQSHLSDAVPPPHQLRPDLSIPPELSYVFWQALAKSVEERFPSVRAFVEAFATSVRGRSGPASAFFAASYS